MAKKLTTYRVTARAVLVTDTEIQAESFEQAAQKATELKIDDFAEISGECIDYQLEIASISNPERWEL